MNSTTTSTQADIVLTTFNARYIHSAFGLRYLRANLGDLRPKSQIHEFTIHERPVDALEAVLAYEPKIVGVSVFIWNVKVVEEFVSALKRVRPDIVVVVGGPEVTYELENQPLNELADYVVKGPGDVAFRILCEDVLTGENTLPHVVSAEVDFDQLTLPYREYTDEDVAHRILYVEASRGCPFRCEFCLSSLDRTVTGFELDSFLAEMQELFDRGVRHFKFVDRTFNLKVDTALRIVEFFHERYEPGLFVHFEMVPDRLPEELRESIAQFPPGALQFEVGIQTFNPEVAKNISRRQNYDKLADNLRFLREETGVHVHADLIVGLPGETVESFGAGFDVLVELGPQEIQVGVLKRLRGTPIVRHDEAFQMVYSEHPPYEILRNSSMSFGELQEMKRFARYWDLIGNSGNFRDSLRRLLGDQPFANFRAFAAWLYAESGERQHGISLINLTQFVFTYLVEQRGEPEDTIAPEILRDYQRAGRPKVPKFLKPFSHLVEEAASHHADSIPARQTRHL